ncbi:MAG: thymidine phosphorylase [Chloroflexia bacterium]|nr:thymidine phosphorylase [Chloroflexia bacterium]
MRVVDIILKKKAGRALDKEEIDFMVQGYTESKIPDYQVAAWLMAICWQGMDECETTNLTLAMAQSGDTLYLDDLSSTRVDKHSTGGVGDKTSLVLGPLVASCGLTMAKMSGRGLGFTGGTIDKLESIPGFQAELDQEAFCQAAHQTGLVITAQSLDFAPADKKLYALRDVTGTVDSIPLIASSIMSKKLAAGSDCIVLDVKCGHGAFMQTEEQAQQLARAMVEIGQRAGRQVRAVISDMDQPLGLAIGNALEVREAIATLRDQQSPPDLLELCLTLGSLLLEMSGQTKSVEQARQVLHQKLDSGAAWQKFREFISQQGGDVQFVDQPERLPRASLIETLSAPTSGYLAGLDARLVAQACLVLGAGRAAKDDPIDHAVGVVLQAKLGQMVHKGQPLCTIHANDARKLESARGVLQEAFSIQAESVPESKLILEIV